MITTDPGRLSDAKGAYFLLIDIKRSIRLPERFAGADLPKGIYGYAGSAYGSGGIRARCRRHLGRPATRRWHIDWLTGPADHVQALAFPGGTECDLIHQVTKLSGARFPIDGFGSSDCRQCRAHLVMFDEAQSFDDVLLALGV